ncbi:uncharacterized protein LOC113334002 [Papaver somniferum]|uniref:uncharacterized protein LOC113334002 n=1 Tax=Papaver somniferum TaxID=3469 RepID=UPI000E7045B8|nr:uncharacterized protein LOC113334002 [Papaver somniferum]
MVAQLMLFSDKWIQNPSQPLCVSYSNPNHKVAEFINHESKTWKTELIESFFTSENSLKICSMRIPISGSDTLIWPYNRNDILTVKSVYKLLANELSHNSSPNPDFDTHKALWKSQILPRTQLFIWKCFEKILPTGNKLARFNHNHDDRCKSCNSSASETIEHMMLHYFFAKNVWSNIPAVSHSVLQDSDSNNSIKNWISKWLVTKTLQDKSITFLTKAWCIWKDMCSKVFDNKHLNPQITARNALRIVGETISALTPVPVPNITNMATVNDSSFLNSISQNCLLIYCDASFDHNSNDSGVGMVAINSSGEFKGCKLVSGRSTCSEGAESVAILEAASWIKKNNFKNFYIISDAKNIMAYLNNSKGQTSWTSCSVLDDCLFILKDSLPLGFIHLRRDLNSLADIATKHSRIMKISGEWDANNYPYFLPQAVISH